MRTIPSSDLQRKLGEVQDAALKEPIAITRNGRERLVLLSADEYRRLKRRDRVSAWAWELSDELIDAIEKSEVPAEFDHLNAELDEKP